MGLNSTDKKLLLAIIWFTLGWGKSANAIPLKSLRAFAKVSEKALYASRKRLIALKLIRVREQLPACDTRGKRRQGHTEYSVLLRSRPYERLDYKLVEAVAPQLRGPEVALWLVVMRKQGHRAFWFAPLTQLEELTGYRPTAVKDARNSLLQYGLIDGYRGFGDWPSVAGYRSLATPIQADDSRQWADVYYHDLWYHLEEQQREFTDSSIRPRLSANEVAFLSNVYEQAPRDFLAATGSITCHLAETGQLHLYERKLMALANKLHYLSRDRK
jgi:hypothetical protein